MLGSARSLVDGLLAGARRALICSRRPGAIQLQRGQLSLQALFAVRKGQAKSERGCLQRIQDPGPQSEYDGVFSRLLIGRRAKSSSLAALPN